MTDRTPAGAGGPESAVGDEIVVDLAEVPALGRAYARGLAGSARLAATSRGRVAGALPDVTYRVRGVRADADHLTAYQHLLGESASDALPAGFVHVLAFPVATALMVRDDFPLPLLGLVHLANVVEQRRPVHLGEELEVRASARDLRPHRAGTSVDLVTEVRAAGSDDVAWRGVSTYLAKGVRGAGERPADDDAPRAAFEPPVPTGRWHLAADTGRRYAEVSGDRNPIHLSALGAKAFGFPRAIAHGMYTASRALADVGAARTGAFRWTVDFARPVLLPGTVQVRVAAADDGFAYAAWNGTSGSLHLTGAVVPA